MSKKDSIQIVPASPKARKFARELGVDINKVKGSERDGRVIEEDIKSFVKDKSNQDITIEYNQTNPKQKSSKAYER